MFDRGLPGYEKTSNIFFNELLNFDTEFLNPLFTINVQHFFQRSFSFHLTA